MAHRISLMNHEKQVFDISSMVGSISWKSNIDQLGLQLDFDLAFNDTKYFPDNPVDLGNVIILENEDEIFRGVAITENRNGRGSIGYTAMDYAFYLNKSKMIYQFNKISVSQAIHTILKDLNIPIGAITEIPTVIQKICKGEVASDIIKGLLKQAKDELGRTYRMEMRQGKLFIEEQQQLQVKPTFKLASNLTHHDGQRAISNPSRKRSIEEMRNSIKIISGDENSTSVVADKKDDELIRKYGLLQEVQTPEKKDIAQARNIAANLLADLGKVFEQNSVEMPGDDSVRAGRLIEIEEPVTGMKGQYLVRSASHTVANGIHRMNLDLGVV